MKFAERFPKLTIGLISLTIAVMAIGVEVTALNAAGYTTILN